jgi:hypothetical protein
MYMVSTWALRKSEAGAVTFDVLIEERPPESLEELHTDSVDLLVT